MDEKDEKRLLKALYILSRLAAPVLFKYASAAGVDVKDMEEMHKTFKELNDKYNK